MPYYKKRSKLESDAFYESFNFRIPKKQMEALRVVSSKNGKSIARLIAIAIDNELDQAEPFYYPALEPTQPYQEYAFATESKMLLSALKNAKPMPRESLMLLRRELGIPDRKVLMLALRELLMAGFLVEAKPKQLRPGQDPELKLIRVATEDEQKVHFSRALEDLT